MKHHIATTTTTVRGRPRQRHHERAWSLEATLELIGTMIRDNCYPSERNARTKYHWSGMNALWIERRKHYCQEHNIILCQTDRVWSGRFGVTGDVSGAAEAVKKESLEAMQPKVEARGEPTLCECEAKRHWKAWRAIRGMKGARV